jgi:ribosomal-protein-alanine N-acetyltransferase
MIRLATLGDMNSLIELDRSSPTAAHWSEHQYQKMFGVRDGAAERLVLVAENRSSQNPNSGAIFGFLVARRVASEWELENIVVAPGARRKNLGTELLAALLTQARTGNDAAVFLEVRESNSGARAFYERLGFEQTGRRPRYYADSPEDAILYRLVVAKISS